MWSHILRTQFHKSLIYYQQKHFLNCNQINFAIAHNEDTINTLENKSA